MSYPEKERSFSGCFDDRKFGTLQSLTHRLPSSLLTIETPEEAALFHDHVACKIANSGQFIGDAYMASMGPLKANGIVNLKGFQNAEDS